MNHKDICNYVFELGALKKFHHSGTKLAGVQKPDTIAEHAFRTAIIAYILAEMENANTSKCLLIALLHDNAEARITDLHKVALRYLDGKQKAETKAFQEQVQKLPPSISKTFYSCFQEYEYGDSKEADICRDADLLETAFQCKEYIETGYKSCEDWLKNIKKALQTSSAKKIFQEIKKTSFTDWYKVLKKLS